MVRASLLFLYFPTTNPHPPEPNPDGRSECEARSESSSSARYGGVRIEELAYRQSTTCGYYGACHTI